MTRTHICPLSLHDALPIFNSSLRHGSFAAFWLHNNKGRLTRGCNPTSSKFIHTWLRFGEIMRGSLSLEYRFWVTYSLHCFTKDYEHQTNEEKQSLMYHAPKESRPFCQHRYNLARTHLKRTILALPESNVIHAGYGSYAVIEVDLDGGDKAFYFVAFRAFREKKKLRLHVTSAYPISEKQKGKSVKFFTIAYNLLRNKQLPQPSK